MPQIRNNIGKSAKTKSAKANLLCMHISVHCHLPKLITSQCLDESIPITAADIKKGDFLYYRHETEISPIPIYTCYY